MLRVMTFNILQGGQDRLPLIFEIIKKADADIVILQECVGWGDQQLSSLATTMGVSLAHVVLAQARPRPSEKRFHVAVASRLPLTMRRVHADQAYLGHCIAECSVPYQHKPLTIFGAHFDSHHENLRFVEARYLRAQIPREEFLSGYYLLGGDLNSLSKRDPYPQDFAEKVKQAGVEKYGQPPRFEVIQEIEDFGWVDTLWSKKTPENWVTAPRDRGGVHIDYRTDYLFASPKLAENLVSTEIIDTTNASDHHAVVANFG
jgi:exodeoxyribonuclease-3